MAHHNCNYVDQSGYNVVEVVCGFCEVGEGCDGVKVGCPYAWKAKDSKTTRNANKVYAEFVKQLDRPLS